MITTETITIHGREYVRTRSDAGKMIRGGNPEGLYSEAVDPADAGRAYIETDIPIPVPDPEDEEITDAEALAIITGGDAT